MDGGRSEPRAPAWTQGAKPRDALIRGVCEAPSVPVIVVLITFVGFGALCRDVGLTVGQASFISVTVFALPGQVVLADQIAHGATLAVAAFAVALTAVRLLPMTVALMPHLRDEAMPRWLYYPAAHFIAITVWIEAFRRLPPLPRAMRVPYFIGFGTTVLLAGLIATVAGYAGAARMPLPVAAGMIFMSPIYFFISLLAGAETRTDVAALACGAVLGPLLFLVLPGLDLLATGLIAGTGAYLLGRLGRRAT